ncbi:MAG: hypothetical protein QW434_03970, partial [Pyrobaculum sp.]
IRNSKSKTRRGGEISERRYRHVYYIDLSGIVVKAETYDLTQPGNPLMSEIKVEIKARFSPKALMALN